MPRFPKSQGHSSPAVQELLPGSLLDPLCGDSADHREPRGPVGYLWAEAGGLWAIYNLGKAEGREESRGWRAG